MGCCLSKKCSSGSPKPAGDAPPAAATVADICSAPSEIVPEQDPNVFHSEVNTKKTKKKMVEEKQEEEAEAPKEEKEAAKVKKEVFIIQHRKSHEKRSPLDQISPAPDGVGSGSTVSTSSANETAAESSASNNNASINGSMRVRTPSFTKEEVDAILIQCGKLSRSSSGKATSSSGGGRKRQSNGNVNDCCDDEGTSEEKGIRRRRSRSSSHGRRRTPSREREQSHHQRRRSSSREKTSGGGRRVSRSPGRRALTDISNTANSSASCGSTDTAAKPGKMVSVPATVNSFVTNNANAGGDGSEAGNIKRIAVKRNVSEVVVAGSRGAASPRSQSPARGNVKASGENLQPSLSRNSSRKAGQSPYRRNPLGDIDQNCLTHPQSMGNKNACNSRKQNGHEDAEEDVPLSDPTQSPNQASVQRPDAEMEKDRGAVQATCHKVSKRETLENKALSKNCTEEGEQPPLTGNNAETRIAALGAEIPKPQTLTRSRSSRRSRDLDFNPETWGNPTSSYTALLLEDIHNFHQKNTTTATVPANVNKENKPVSLPPSVNKAYSIVEAVADLYSGPSSLLSGTSLKERNKL